MSEPLPFQEYIELEGWRHRHIDIESYRALWRKTVEDYVSFWDSEARKVEWFTPWVKTMEKGDYPHVYRWFVGGELNLSYLCLDIHNKTWRRNKLALVWEGERSMVRGCHSRLGNTPTANSTPR